MEHLRAFVDGYEPAHVFVNCSSGVERSSLVCTSPPPVMCTCIRLSAKAAVTRLVVLPSNLQALLSCSSQAYGHSTAAMAPSHGV
eukprot:scaffold261030_cov19-Tisochrysis_lutea.AAC.1